MDHRVKVFWLLIAIAFGTVTVVPQTDDDVIRVDTRLIEVPIVVSDRVGNPITNLKKSNFEVFEDDKKQEIAEFASTETPFEVVLLLDTSGSARGDLELIKRGAADFVALLRPRDKIAIYSFTTERSATIARGAGVMLSGFTDDRKALDLALEKITTSNSTPFYDSLVSIGKMLLETKKSGNVRRAVVAMTDGVDSVSTFEFEDARVTLERAGTAAYFVKINTRDAFEDQLLGNCENTTRFSVAQIKRYYRVFYPNSKIEKTYDFCKLGDFERLGISKGLYEIAEKEMVRLAASSGGRIFPATDVAAARTAFKSVATEIGTQYSLGYYSTNEKADGRMRKIKVELKGLPAGAKVRARESYVR